MSIKSKAIDASADIAAAKTKVRVLREELGIPDTNHTWLKAMQFLDDARDRIAEIVAACNTVPKDAS